MMKKLLFVVLLLYAQNFLAQIDANLLMGLPQATTLEINNITTATIQQGSLVFNTDRKKIYQFNGTDWKELLESPSVFLKTGNYTLLDTDNHNILTFNSATDITLTVPTGLPTGYNVSIYQIGDGKIFISGVSGVTIKNRLLRFKTAGKDAGAGIISTNTNVFHLTGDLKRN